LAIADNAKRYQPNAHKKGSLLIVIVRPFATRAKSGRAAG